MSRNTLRGKEGENESARSRQGRVYLRGKTYWVQYNFRGNTLRESAETSDEKKAKKFLNARLKERERPGFIGPKEERWTLDDLEAKIIAQYARDENRSSDTVKMCLAHVKKHFPFHRVVDIATSDIEKYQQTRLDQGAARSSINRECAYLRHGMRLMHQAGEISRIPKISLLQGEHIREGFLDVGTFHALVEALHGKTTKTSSTFCITPAGGRGKQRSSNGHRWTLRPI